MDKSRALVIIPAYDEERSIGRVIKGVQENFPDADVVVIDDGSSDGTAKLARKAGARVLCHTVNLGPGAATQTGYKYALRHSYELVVQLDADGQHDPRSIKDLLNVLENESCDLVIGSRFLGDEGYEPSQIRKIGMSFFGALTSLIVKQKITDSTSGFRVLNRKVVDFLANIDYPSDYPDADVIILAHFAGFRIKEIPVIMYKNTTGKSLLGGARFIYYGFKVLLSVIVTLLREKPSRERGK